MNIGDSVRVLAPFDAAFPGVYTVDAVSADGATATVYGDRDFDVQYLRATDEAVTHPSPAPAFDPAEVISAAQARVMLLRTPHPAGSMLAAVNALMNDPSTPDEVKIFWEYEASISRSSAALNDMARLLGIDSAQLDQMFAAAKQIAV